MPVQSRGKEGGKEGQTYICNTNINLSVILARIYIPYGNRSKLSTHSATCMIGRREATAKTAQKLA